MQWHCRLREDRALHRRWWERLLGEHQMSIVAIHSRDFILTYICTHCGDQCSNAYDGNQEPNVD